MGLDIYFNKAKKGNDEWVIEKELAYFRKVNFLVAYFTTLDNGEYHDDIMDCHYVEIAKSDIQRLVKKCDEVLKLEDDLESSLEPNDILPTTTGFFFGSAEYDRGYYADVEEVKTSMERILQELPTFKEDETITFRISY